MQLTPGYCPYFHHTAELLGRRWTAVILRTLSSGPQRFSDVRAGIPGLSDRLLTNRLAELEAEGIVVRCERHGAACYALTTKGEQVLPVLEAVRTLAATWASDEPPATKPGRIRTAP